MEENKIDPYQILGFVFLSIAFVWYIYTVPDVDQYQASKQDERLSDEQQLDKEESLNKNYSSENSIEIVGLNSSKKTLSIAENNFDDISIENEDLFLKFSSKGGMLSEALLKDYNDYKGDPLYLIKDFNQNINLSFSTLDGRIINTKNYFFKPLVSSNSQGTVVNMLLTISDNQSLSFEYILPKNGFMIDFNIKSIGLDNIIDFEKSSNLTWDLKVFRQAKSVDYENRYSQLYYQYDEGDTNYLSSYSDSDKNEDSVTWISYGQHFFNSILVLESPSDNVSFESKKLFEDQGKDVMFTKNYVTNIPLIDVVK